MGWRYDKALNKWHFVETVREKERRIRREEKNPRLYSREKTWTQADACPYCGVLNWARFTANYYHLAPEKKVKYTCRNCKKVYLGWIFGDNFD